MSAARVRPARPTDAAILATGVGCAFFSPGSNTEVAARSVFLHDLWVGPAARDRLRALAAAR